MPAVLLLGKGHRKCETERAKKSNRRCRRTSNDGKLTADAFKNFCSDHGVNKEPAPWPYSPQHSELLWSAQVTSCLLIWTISLCRVYLSGFGNLFILRHFFSFSWGTWLLTSVPLRWNTALRREVDCIASWSGTETAGVSEIQWTESP